ncbi:hypothetical protein PK34_18880 [Stutzerimonas stutzeri]|nr:hypothetical protein PK34_18880 [Stutzerimonas stutzeri]
MNILKSTQLTLAQVAALALTACSSIQPQPLTKQSMTEQGLADRIGGCRAHHSARCRSTKQSRARKYKLDRSSRMMREALAFPQLNVARYDMLLKLLAQADCISLTGPQRAWPGLLSRAQPSCMMAGCRRPTRPRHSAGPSEAVEAATIQEQAAEAVERGSLSVQQAYRKALVSA